MKPNLYEILGVSRMADDQEIKKAYRKLSQKLHPDKEGGSHTEFQEMKAAYETLSDPEKRAHYDATGDIPKPVQSDEQVLREQAIAALSKVFMMGIQQVENVEQTNVLEILTGMVRGEITRIQGEHASHERLIAKHEKVVRRIRSKEGENVAGHLVQQMLDMLRKDLTMMDKRLAVANAMKDIMDNHEYTVDEAPPGMMWIDEATLEAMRRGVRFQFGGGSFNPGG